MEPRDAWCASDSLSCIVIDELYYSPFVSTLEMGRRTRPGGWGAPSPAKPKKKKGRDRARKGGALAGPIHHLLDPRGFDTQQARPHRRTPGPVPLRGHLLSFSGANCGVFRCKLLGPTAEVTLMGKADHGVPSSRPRCTATAMYLWGSQFDSQACPFLAMLDET